MIVLNQMIKESLNVNLIPKKDHNIITHYKYNPQTVIKVIMKVVKNYQFKIIINKRI